MANDISKVGLGFFTATGALKSDKQLATESSSPTPAQPETEILDESSAGSALNALGSVRSRFSASINETASALNLASDDLKGAAELIKNQISAAKELKKALKDEDKEAVVKARAALEEATEQRNSFVSKLDSERADRDVIRSKNLSLGNQQLGIITVEPIKLEKTEDNDLTRPKDVEKLLDTLREDRASIKGQRQAVRDTREQVIKIAAAVDQKVSLLEERSVRSFDEAKNLSEKLSSQITSQGSQALTASQINSRVAELLLR
jgi:predicted  nucleic acid-binding Zn-ribbon protein